MATATQIVIDKQDKDGSWQGVASMWNIAVPFAITDMELITGVLDAFKKAHPLSVFRVVQKTRTETGTETVVNLG